MAPVISEPLREPSNPTTRRDAYQPYVAPDPVTQAVVGGLPGDVKHCWVATPGGPVPALPVGWRHDQELGWLGRVVRRVRDQHGWLVMEDWLPSAELRPARGDLPGG